MSRDAELFESTTGNVIDAFILFRENCANIPESWIARSQQSRKSRQKKIISLLRKRSLDVMPLLSDWYKMYQKECFYRGIRILLDLERNGKSKH